MRILPNVWGRVSVREGRKESCSARISGVCRPPGDKSISHRALLIGMLALGETRIEGMLESTDILSTMRVCRQLGARVSRQENTVWSVQGQGSVFEPSSTLECGNSGTLARLVAGIVAGNDIFAVLTGDESLNARPMKRVLDPLEQTGASFMARQGAFLPLAIRGRTPVAPLEVRLEVASAQLKSAVLLAGLSAPGETRLTERVPTRDHTETMLRQFGAEIASSIEPDGMQTLRLAGQPVLQACTIEVPGDFSAAGFPLIAALICPDSRLEIENIGLNPLRTGLLEILREMGAQIRILPAPHKEKENPAKAQNLNGKEPSGTLIVESSELKGVSVPPHRVASMIDEFPILAMAAACASGTTRFESVGELRVKESDRLARLETGLRACGVQIQSGADWLEIQGCGAASRIAGGARIETGNDHRIAMGFAVLGLASKTPLGLSETDSIATSFPDFAGFMERIGAGWAETAS